MRRVLLLTLLAFLAAVVVPPRFARLFAQTSKTTTPPAPLKFKVGGVAPDFTLKDQDGKNVSLYDFRGKKTVVLAFYVFAFSGG